MASTSTATYDERMFDPALTSNPLVIPAGQSHLPDGNGIGNAGGSESKMGGVTGNVTSSSSRKTTRTANKTQQQHQQEQQQQHHHLAPLLHAASANYQSSPTDEYVSAALLSQLGDDSPSASPNLNDTRDIAVEAVKANDRTKSHDDDGTKGGSSENGGMDNDGSANGGDTPSRALKDTKRAAQNRSAQRAFRERKEHYVTNLERKSQLLDETIARERELAARLALIESRKDVLDVERRERQAERETFESQRTAWEEQNTNWEQERASWMAREAEWRRECEKLKGALEESRRQVDNFRQPAMVRDRDTSPSNDSAARGSKRTKTAPSH